MIIGIDPGVSGAIAFIGDNDAAAVRDAPTYQPGKRRRIAAGEFARIVRAHLADEKLRRSGETVTAFIEAAWPRPSDGAVFAFTSGHGHGVYVGVLAAMDIPTTAVAPQKWTATLGVQKPKGAEKRDKGLSLELARKLFPELALLLRREKDNGRAEALLIAHFARLSVRGELFVPRPPAPTRPEPQPECEF